MDIKEMYENGLSINEIARRTGRDRKTIRKVLESDKPQKSVKRRNTQSCLDPYKDYIIQRMAQGVLNAEKILKEIKAQGYPGQITILRLFMQPFRPLAEKRYTERYETGSGEQAQCDWGSFGYIYDQGRRQKLYGFVMVLSYSRLMYLEFTTQMDTETLMRCHINAFNYFNGVTDKILYDNQKTVVLGRDSEGHLIWNERFLNFARHYGFIPKLCRPYRPRTKGKVERLIRYVKENFFCGLQFSDLVDLNQQALNWLNTTANTKIHQTTQAIPFERWEEEKLKPISIHPFDTATYTQRRVSMDCLISYQRNYYSVPWELAGRDIIVRIEQNQLEVIFNGKIYTRYQLAKGQYQRIINREHYQGIKKVKSCQLIKSLILTSTSPLVQIRSLAEYESLIG
ncbi:MAG: IS21 family transposase [Firmicutes bacterium]|nr:IS21 family transposase [Bacillota bacterium]